MLLFLLPIIFRSVSVLPQAITVAVGLFVVIHANSCYNKRIKNQWVLVIIIVAVV